LPITAIRKKDFNGEWQAGKASRDGWLKTWENFGKKPLLKRYGVPGAFWESYDGANGWDSRDLQSKSIVNVQVAKVPPPPNPVAFDQTSANKNGALSRSRRNGRGIDGLSWIIL